MMPIIALVVGIILLIFLISVCKINAFISLIFTSLFVGIIGGMNLSDTMLSVQNGIGDTMGSLVLILVFGAMLGKLIEKSGAALSITKELSRIFGEKHMQAVFIVTGFLVGLPMIYNASFLVLIPLVYAFAVSSRCSLLYLGIPMSASLSVAHGFLPPHPAPTAVNAMFNADINLTLLYGLLACVPAIILAGPVLSRAFRNVYVLPPKGYVETKPTDDMPSFRTSLFVTLLPIVLILVGTLFGEYSNNAESGIFTQIARFISNPSIALMSAVAAGAYFLCLRRGASMSELMSDLSDSVGSIAMIILVIGGGGAFKQVLIDSGTADYIKDLALSFSLNPILMAWMVAALLRLAVGSATVAAITAAGIMHSVVGTGSVSPELMVMASCSGSLMFSHFNDIGFWMFKEYYNVTVKQTFMMWTVMESIVAIIGLGMSFLLFWMGA